MKENVYIDFEHPDPPIDQEGLDKFETLLSCQLPKKYLDYINKYPTGELPVKDLCFDIYEYGNLDSTDICEQGMLNELSNVEDLFTSYKYMSSEERERNWLPDDMIVIGGNPGGDYILLCISGKHTGEVFYWRDALFPVADDVPASYVNIGKVADSFELFISFLYECYND